MKGLVLEDERRSLCLHVPEAHIKIYVTKAGDGSQTVCAFRTDGYYEIDGELQPIEDHMKTQLQATW